MKCDRCGREIEDGMAFCPSCGTSVRRQEIRPDPWEVKAEGYREPGRVEPPRAPEPPKPYWQNGAGQGDGAAQQPPRPYSYQGATPPPQGTSPYIYQRTPYGATPESATTNTMAVVGLIIGAISFLFNFFGVVGLAATICSAIALSQIKRSGQRGEGLAVAGLVLGIIGILWGLLTLVFFVGAIVSYSGPRFY